MPGRRSASIDLPVPGGPMNSRLCAAGRGDLQRTLGGRLALHVAQVGRGRCRRRGQRPRLRQRRCVVARLQRLHHLQQAVGGADVQRADPGRGLRAFTGQHQAARGGRRGARPAPGPARRAPAAARRPATARRQIRRPSRRCGSIAPAAARMPSAIGRSKRPDSLGRSAGARLTVMRLLCGKAKPLCSSAARTRSRDSFTSVSARPTSVKLGRPLARCTSTVTAWACKASSARLWTTAKDMDLHHASAMPRQMRLPCTKAAPLGCVTPANGAHWAWRRAMPVPIHRIGAVAWFLHDALRIPKGLSTTNHPPGADP